MYVAFEVEVHVVELSNNISNCLAVDSQLGLDRGQPCVKLVWLSAEFLGIGVARLRFRFACIEE